MGKISIFLTALVPRLDHPSERMRAWWFDNHAGYPSSVNPFGLVCKNVQFLLGSYNLLGLITYR